MDKSSGNNAKKFWLSSSVFWGLIALAGFNFFCVKADLMKACDPESLPAAHTWVWWATQEFLSEPTPPKVVLLGSSLVMHPVSRLDANYLNESFDYVHHHKSIYLQESLEKQLGAKDITCFNYALPGGMISDDYMIERAMLTGKKKPRLIVLGLSLRDFVDNGVHNAASTAAFRYLQRFCSVDDLVDVSMPQIWQRLDYWQGKALYLWGKKLDLQVALGENAKKIARPVISSLLPASLLDQADVTRNMPSNLRAEVEEGMFFVEANKPYSFEDNSQEYRKRYRNGNEFLFGNQSIFLYKLLRLASRENIKVLLVNMPLTAQNKALMPTGYYQRYLAVLEGSCKKWNDQFLDLGAGSEFNIKDFYDTSHMNADGGKKLVDAIAGQLVRSDEMASALKAGPSQDSLAGRAQSF